MTQPGGSNYNLDTRVAVGGGGGLLALGALVYVLGLEIWLTGQITGLIFNGTWPKSNPGDAGRIVFGFFGDLGDPAQAWPEAARPAVGPVWAFYPFLLIFLVPTGIGLFFAIRYALRFRLRRESRRFRLGFADGGEVSKLLSARAVAKKAKSVRPSYAGKRKINPLEVGFYLGRDIRSQQKLYCSVEDVMLVVAPPRQGKDVHFCVPNIIDAPGPCIATTTRADMFINTVSAREKVGRVWVFDPNGMTNWPSQLRWSPVNGCHDPLVALNRASAFVSGAGVGEGVQNATYWTGVAIAILRCYLMAAAMAGKTITDVQRWSNQPTNPEPIQILRVMEAQGRAPQGWAGELESNSSADPESRGSMWSGVRRALDCLADPGVLAACSPRPEEEFNVSEFVKGRNTLYVLGKEKKNGSVAPLVTAMMEDIFDQVRKIAGRQPKSRIDPPLTVELNEVAHIAPMPNLPGYMGDSGGFSIALHIYLQSLGQARGKWGNDEAAVMWDTAAIRIIMGGSGYVNDLDEVSRLLGEVDEKQKSISKGAGGRSISYSKQKRRVLTVDELRTLEFGTAVVIARAARPVEVKLLPYFKRKDAKEIAEGQSRVTKMLAELEQKQLAGVVANAAPPMPAQRDLWAEQQGGGTPPPPPPPGGGGGGPIVSAPVARIAMPAAVSNGDGNIPAGIAPPGGWGSLVSSVPANAASDPWSQQPVSGPPQGMPGGWGQPAPTGQQPPLVPPAMSQPPASPPEYYHPGAQYDAPPPVGQYGQYATSAPGTAPPPVGQYGTNNPVPQYAVPPVDQVPPQPGWPSGVPEAPAAPPEPEPPIPQIAMGWGPRPKTDDNQ